MKKSNGFDTDAASRRNLVLEKKNTWSTCHGIQMYVLSCSPSMTPKSNPILHFTCQQ